MVSWRRDGRVGCLRVGVRGMAWCAMDGYLCDIYGILLDLVICSCGDRWRCGMELMYRRSSRLKNRP